MLKRDVKLQPTLKPCWIPDVQGGRKRGQYLRPLRLTAHVLNRPDVIAWFWHILRHSVLNTSVKSNLVKFTTQSGVTWPKSATVISLSSTATGISLCWAEPRTVCLNSVKVVIGLLRKRCKFERLLVRTTNGKWYVHGLSSNASFDDLHGHSQSSLCEVSGAGIGFWGTRLRHRNDENLLHFWERI